MGKGILKEECGEKEKNKGIKQWRTKQTNKLITLS